MRGACSSQYTRCLAVGADQNISATFTALGFPGTSSLHPCLQPLSAITNETEWLICVKELSFFLLKSFHKILLQMTGRRPQASRSWSVLQPFWVAVTESADCEENDSTYFKDWMERKWKDISTERSQIHSTDSGSSAWEVGSYVML